MADNTEATGEAAVPDSDQGRFEAAAETCMNAFRTAAEAAGAELAIAVVWRSGLPPQIEHLGHRYDVAALLAGVLGSLREELLRRLDP